MLQYAKSFINIRKTYVCTWIFKYRRGIVSYQVCGVIRNMTMRVPFFHIIYKRNVSANLALNTYTTTYKTRETVFNKLLLLDL